MSENAERPRFVLRETFHRIKRTLLLFAAALIVLGYSTTEASNSINIAPIDGELPAVIVRLLLTVGLGYYSVGFFLEFLAARRDHGERAKSTEIADHEAKIRDMVSDVEELSQRITSSGSTYLSDLQAGVSELSFRVTGPEALEDQEFDQAVMMRSEGDGMMLNRATPEQRAEYYQRIRDSVRSRHASIVSSQAEQYLLGPERVEKALMDSRADYEILIAALGSVKRDLKGLYRRTTRLNRHIERETRLGFFGWELGGAAVAATFALLIAWTDFGPWSSRILQQLITLPVA